MDVDGVPADPAGEVADLGRGGDHGHLPESDPEPPQPAASRAAASAGNGQPRPRDSTARGNSASPNTAPLSAAIALRVARWSSPTARGRRFPRRPRAGPARPARRSSGFPKADCRRGDGQSRHQQDADTLSAAVVGSAIRPSSTCRAGRLPRSNPRSRRAGRQPAATEEDSADHYRGRGRDASRIWAASTSSRLPKSSCSTIDPEW